MRFYLSTARGPIVHRSIASAKQAIRLARHLAKISRKTITVHSSSFPSMFVIESKKNIQKIVIGPRRSRKPRKKK